MELLELLVLEGQEKFVHFIDEDTCGIYFSFLIMETGPRLTGNDVPNFHFMCHCV